MNHDMSRSALEDGPDVEEDDGEPGDDCSHCDGAGGWSSTFVDSNDREYDADYECPKCDGSGKR